jgi:hypothetical protein
MGLPKPHRAHPHELLCGALSTLTLFVPAQYRAEFSKHGDIFGCNPKFV